MQPYVRLARTALQSSQAYFRLPQSHLQAKTKRTYLHDTRPFSNSTPPSHLWTNRIRIRIMTAARAHSVSNSQLQRTDTCKIFLPKFRQISRMTLGSIKKPEFQRKPEDSYPCMLHKVLGLYQTPFQCSLCKYKSSIIQSANTFPKHITAYA